MFMWSCALHPITLIGNCGCIHPYTVRTKKKMESDTLCCEIFDSLGVHKGSSAGLFYQAQYGLGQIVFSSADTLTVSIAHMMDGDVDGVRSVGVRVERCGRHLSSGN